VALANYNDIVDAIPVWLHRQGDQEVQAIAPDLVALAETEINVRLRTRYQEHNFESPILSGTIPIPTDYTDLKFAYLDGTPRQHLTRKSVDWIQSQYPYRSADSRPEFIARDFDAFVFGPYPDADYTVKGVYYRMLPPLALVQTNPLLTRYPAMFLFGALLKAEIFIRNDPSIDQMKPTWEAEFARALDYAQGEDDRENMSGGLARMNLIGSMP
jgi:hypothetical protein